MSASARLYDWVAISVRTILEITPRDEQWRIATLAQCLADDFGHDNPRFDRKRFYTACGLSLTGRTFK